ncbi:MAG: ATP-dependent sacrificial sulfur transferase LarE [Candidatus Sericytochromatia bacterium]|nr:ATP-dependent sacrificial sulfur transferase LarE [Candidatus Sericytochromatia bacterium]
MRSPTFLIDRLQDRMSAWGSALVALSGGVDSAVVLQLAALTLPGRVQAATSHAPSVAESERVMAAQVAAAAGVRHHLLDPGEMGREDYLRNGTDRCFHCKDALYGALGPLAARLGLQVIANGVHVEDLGDHRPGLVAADRHGILSPLRDEGLTKEEVRAVARHLGLAVWNRPANACLASRLPHGTPVTLERLDRVARAEAALARLGLQGHRVRDHGELARLEVPGDAFDWVLHRREALQDALLDAGYRLATLDLGGYKPAGSHVQNETSIAGPAGGGRA